MSTHYREFPEDLVAAIEKARTFHEIAWKAGPEKIALDSPRMPFLGAFVTILFEHHSSVILLFETGANDASAFALLRVLIDTFYRGFWVHRCASDDQIDVINSGGAPYPKFIEMTRQVDQQLGAHGKLPMNEKLWGLLNGFTHSGLEQLSRRFDSEGNLRPNYDLEAIIDAIGLATRLLSTLTEYLCVVSGRQQDGGEVREALKRLYDT